MTRKFLWGMVVVLLLTNLTTLLVWLNTDKAPSENPNNKLRQPVAASEEEVVASIGDESILHQNWLTMLEKRHGKTVLEELINKEVVFQLAEEKGIQLNDKVMERELALMETMLGVTSDSKLKEKRKTWQEQVRYNYLLEELMTQDIGIEEKKIKDYYEEYKDQYDFQKSFQFSHIVVSTEEEAKKVAKELEDGSSFEILAREYSTDSSTRGSGGYLGYFSKDSSYVPDEYFKRAQKLSAGSYSDPFETDQGYVLLYVHRMLPKINISYEDVKQHIKRQLALDYVGDSVSVKTLWDDVGVEWFYGD